MYNRQLDTFIKVADSGSFSKAGKALFITPTAVIKQINLLEANLGLKLFNRTNRGIFLTDSGKSLYKDAKYMIQYGKDSIVRAKNAMEVNENVIRIGSSLMTPSQFLIELWPKIHEESPNIKLQMVSFENTPENARQILMHLGENIDIVGGIFDRVFLKNRKCAALELNREPICCAVSIHHRLASKEKISINDLYGENLMLIRRGWNSYVDSLRDDICANYPQIKVVDFPFYDVNIFNECESGNNILMVVGNWKNVHPMLKILPVDWNYTIPFGILYSLHPSSQVLSFIKLVEEVLNL